MEVKILLEINLVSRVLSLEEGLDVYDVTMQAGLIFLYLSSCAIVVVLIESEFILLIRQIVVDIGKVKLCDENARIQVLFLLGMDHLIFEGG